MTEKEKEKQREEITNWNMVIAGLERLEKIWNKQRGLIADARMEQLPLKAQRHLVHEFNLYPFDEAIPILIAYVYSNGGNYKDFMI